MFIKTEKELESTHKIVMRLKVEVDVKNPLLAEFWWTNSQSDKKGATIKYERLLDFCYGCRVLGSYYSSL